MRNSCKMKLLGSNKALMRNDDMIGGLNNKIDELESKVMKCTKEVSTLKIDKQMLEIENRALKSTSAKATNTRMDLSNLYKGQKPNDKSGLGYKKYNVLPSKHLRSPKENGKQTQNYKGTNVNYQSTRNVPNHAYKYRFNNGVYGKNKPPTRYVNPKWSNNVYIKDPSGWRYEVKGNQSANVGSRLSEMPRVVSQQTNNTSKLDEGKNKKVMTQAQDLKNDYYN